MIRALVTGGSGDIGAAICRRLAVDGYHVIVHAATNPVRAETLVEKLADQGASAQAICFDVTDQAATERELNTLIADAPVQIVVSNAGIHDDAPLAGMSPEQWHRVIDVSLPRVLQRVPAIATADDRHTLGPCHCRVLDRRPARKSRSSQLRGR